MTEAEFLSLTEYLPAEFERPYLTEDEGLFLYQNFGNQVKVEFPSPATGNKWRLINQAGWVISLCPAIYICTCAPGLS